ncbi:MAG TPA: hypothetical protein VKI64_02880, partial [Acidimicrobiales bacterium]|nr:hypothetical protein [Acidimicrobiales bacterium]
WLLREPPDLADAVGEVAITDHYLTGTRLRLRMAVDRRGAVPTTYKLGQKVPGPGGGPRLTTNIYLTHAEYELLRTLGGDRLTKVRHSFPPFGVDVFDPPLDGLVLAEAELPSQDEAAAIAGPDLAVAEVTDDDRFTGGRLACTSRPELAACLAEVLGRWSPGSGTPPPQNG